jgi:predicted nucleotidyltransferase
MRLSEKIVDSLSQVFEIRLKPSADSELFLFGSRAETEKKGGDIDLLLLTDAPTKKRAQSLNLELKAALRAAGKDQKVDFTIMTKAESKESPFFATLGKMILLRKW